jgi:hypothetical protein
MIFCGQCGLQLGTGTSRCPRCGTTVEETNTQTPDIHPDDATVASRASNTRNPASPSQTLPPQPLVLRPEAEDNNYGSQIAYDATSMMEAPQYGTQVSQNPTMGPMYTNQYPPQGSYADLGTRASGTYGGGGYPTSTQQGYPQPAGINKLRVTALIVILLGLLLLLIATILFVLQHTNVIAQTLPPYTPTI